MRFWQETELAVLARVFPIATQAGMANVLPGRSWGSIRQQASRMGLHRPRPQIPWTGAQQERLAELFPKTPWPELLEVFAPHTREAIRQRAALLGLHRAQKNPKNWHKLPPIVRELIKARRARGWSQIALAKRIGVDNRRVSTWEIGACFPKGMLFMHWAEALDMALTLRPIKGREQQG